MKDTGTSTYVKDSKDVPQGNQEKRLNPDERNSNLSLVHQVVEEGKDPQEVDKMEEDREVEILSQTQIHELGTKEESVGTLVLCQESHCAERVEVEVDMQAKRTFRRLKSPTRTRKPLRELNGRGDNQMKVGKRKCLIRDEEMEDANSELVQWKKKLKLWRNCTLLI